MEHNTESIFDYVHNDEFESPKADKIIIPVNFIINNDLLNREQECHLFRKYNYLKYKFNILHFKKQRNQYTRPHMESYKKEIFSINALLVKCNKLLSIKIAFKYNKNTHITEDQLISEADLVLCKSINKFDYSRGFKFSTYVYRSMCSALKRFIMQESIHCKRFRINPNVEFSQSNDAKYSLDDTNTIYRRNTLLYDALHKLDKRERFIIKKRFGIDDAEYDHMSLKKIGDILHLSKERIRQIEKNAKEKIYSEIKYAT